MKIVLAGATGFIGTPLRDELLVRGHQLIVLSHLSAGHKASEKRNCELFVPWDGRTLGEWARFVDGAGAVINLSGENIAAKPWTPEQKQKILASRVNATRAIVQAIEKAQTRPKSLINVSAVGYYGDVPTGEVTEQAPRGQGFLAEVCERWENKARQAESFGVRVVLPRFAPVLEKNGGMLAKMLFPFRFFVGGPLGPGRQGMPWVHREDVIRAFVFMLDNPLLSGPVNVAAPDIVTMKEFCKVLGKTLHRPSWLPVPAFMLRRIMGEMADMVLFSQRVIPQKLFQAGFVFRYPDLTRALRAILQPDFLKARNSE